MKYIGLLVMCVLSAGAADKGAVHDFEAWGGLPPFAKTVLLTGWSNGYFSAAADATRGMVKVIGTPTAAQCLGRMSSAQTVAVVDKYYAAHPEQWKISLSSGIVLALIAGKDDPPCTPGHQR